MEGRFLGRPALALSLAGDNPTHYDAAVTMAVAFVRRMLDHPPGPDLLLNINFPDVPLADYGAWEVTRLGNRHKSEPAMKTQDPRRRTVYWIGPAGRGQDAGPGTDFHAISRNNISVTPLQVDLTRHTLLRQLAGWVEGMEAGDG
jgi:5'-nucleotidase